MDRRFRDWLGEAQGKTSDNELARRVGVSPTMIGRYRRGVAPSLSTLRKFATWAKVPPEQLEALVNQSRSARVMILCPKTGRPVPTGLAASPVAFGIGTFGSERLLCQACGEYHAWTKADAFLEGDEPKS